MGQGRLASNRAEIWLPIIQCAWCGRIKAGPVYLPFPLGKICGEWSLSLPWFQPVVIALTHSACPGCANDLARRAGAIGWRGVPEAGPPSAVALSLLRLSGRPESAVFLPLLLVFTYALLRKFQSPR